MPNGKAFVGFVAVFVNPQRPKPGIEVKRHVAGIGDFDENASQ